MARFFLAQPQAGSPDEGLRRPHRLVIGRWKAWPPTTSPAVPPSDAARLSGQLNPMEGLGLDVIGHLDEILIRIPQIDRPNGASRTGCVSRGLQPLADPKLQGA
jgi:hypothetical protein